MLQRFRHIDPNEFIVCGVDTSAGGKDYSAAQFISKTKLDVPMVIHSRNTITEVTPEIHSTLEMVHDQTKVRPVVAYERQNGGSFEMDRLATLNRLNKYEIFHMPEHGKGLDASTKKLGWDTTSASRPKMLQDLKNAIDNRVIRLYHKQTVTELFSFINVRTSSSWKAQAERNSHDDLVMSLAIAWQLYQYCEPPTSPDHAMAQVPEDNLFEAGGFY